MAARLFTPIALGSLQLHNRICVPPMSQCLAHNGIVQPEHVEHYLKLAKSGAGMVVIECTAVSEDGRITPQDLGIWNDEQSAALAGLVHSCRVVAPETKFCLQISHAGRKAFLKDTSRPEPPKSCTCEPYDSECLAPAVLDEAGIRAIISAFADAAERARRAGVDGVQIHAAFGYLIHQFLSPITNRRTDAWGGSLQGRMRFGLEVIRAIRDRVPELPILLRIAATDWIDGGWDVDSTVQFVRQASRLGVIAVDVTAGGLSPQQNRPEAKPGYQVCYASAVKRGAGVPTAAGGLITDPLQAEGILVSGEADLISVGRAVLNNPGWGWMAAQALNAFGSSLFIGSF